MQTLTLDAALDLVGGKNRYQYRIFFVIALYIYV